MKLTPVETYKGFVIADSDYYEEARIGGTWGKMFVYAPEGDSQTVERLNDLWQAVDKRNIEEGLGMRYHPEAYQLENVGGISCVSCLYLLNGHSPSESHFSTTSDDVKEAIDKLWGEASQSGALDGQPMNIF